MPGVIEGVASLSFGRATNVRGRSRRRLQAVGRAVGINVRDVHGRTINVHGRTINVHGRTINVRIVR